MNIIRPQLWTPFADHCPDCGRRRVRRRYNPMKFAGAGAVLLDPDGKRILDSQGRLFLSNGSGDDCCCGSDPTGACCVDDTCSIETQADCATAGGVWYGVGTYCTGGGASPVICPGNLDCTAYDAFDLEFADVTMQTCAAESGYSAGVNSGTINGTVTVSVASPYAYDCLPLDYTHYYGTTDCDPDHASLTENRTDIGLRYKVTPGPSTSTAYVEVNTSFNSTACSTTGMSGQSIAFYHSASVSRCPIYPWVLANNNATSGLPKIGTGGTVTITPHWEFPI